MMRCNALPLTVNIADNGNRLVHINLEDLMRRNWRRKVGKEPNLTSTPRRIHFVVDNRINQQKVDNRRHPNECEKDVTRVRNVRSEHSDTIHISPP